MRGFFVFASLFYVVLRCEAFEVEKHHNYEDVVATLKEVAEKCPDITHYYQLPSPPYHRNTTWEGRGLDVIAFSDKPTEHEPRKCIKLKNVAMVSYTGISNKTWRLFSK